jgi:SNF2 family DNA or RNA helicase
MSATADLQGNGILVTSGMPGELTFLRQMQGARKLDTGAWRLPATPGACALLREQRVAFSPLLQAYQAKADRLRRYLEHTKTADHDEPLSPIPNKPPSTLYRHHVRAYNIGLALRSSAMLMDMGTGKTLSTIMVAGRRYLDGKIRRLLIIAPASVCPVWPAEFQKFADFPARVSLLLGTHEQRVRRLRWLMEPARAGQRDPLRVAVVNYESAWRLKDRTGRRDYLREYDADMIVLDESQRIKTPNARQSTAIHHLGDAARYRMILTGTPIQKDTRDVWSQYRFLDPTVFPCSFYAFQARFAVMGGFNGKQYICPRNLEELTRRTHSIAYRVTKEECLDLPDKLFEERPVLLDDPTMKLYRQIAKDSVTELEGGEVTANHVLVRMLRLQQLTGGFLKADDGTMHPVHTAKLDALEDIVRTVCLDEDKKVVIFTRFLSEMDAIQARLEALFAPGKGERRPKYTLVRIDGSVKSAVRGELVSTFQNDPNCRAFLGEIDACAEGLTLTAATTAVYYSVNWNYAKYDQSVSRIHRIGARGACTYIHLIVPHTIDTKIMAALHAKENLARSVVDNWRGILTEA